MNEFMTDSINLSCRNAETGKLLTANVYKMTFEDGSSRIMSMGQLVMAICLERATEKEDEVIGIMDEMARTTEKIEALSSLETDILNLESKTVYLSEMTGSWTITDDDGTPHMYTRADQMLAAVGVSVTSTNADTIINSIESKLDELNTTSQSQMITLQSETNKRDQSYEMISNIVKSFYTVMSGVVNNV